MSSARAAAAGVGEDQAWSSEALCRSRQAPDALTYISLSQTGREMEREEERERQRERCKQASQEGILTNVPNFKCVCFQGIFRNPEVELNTFYNLYRAFLGVIATLTSNQLHQPHIFTYINHILIAR